MANVFDVAKYILEQIAEQKICNSGACSIWKLQKLCYYAQAWALAWSNGEELFPEEFEAWSNGPVCRPLYLLSEGQHMMDSETLKYGDGSVLTPDQKETIDVVLTAYAHRQPYWLREQSRAEAPWIDARGDIPDHERAFNGPVISKESMRAYYSSLS